MNFKSKLKSKKHTPVTRKKRILRTVGTVVLCAFLLAQIPVFANAYMFTDSNDYILTPEEAADMDVDCILVLGAGVRGEQVTALLKDRLDCGLEVYENGASPKILMSGDHGRKDYDEVNVMKKYAKEHGVPADSIFMDHAGFSTYESMYRARDVFKVKSVIIVTQEYHLYRAIYDARKLGLEAYGVAAHEYDYAFKYDLFNNCREFLARFKDFLWCILKPEPTYLGEAIPISSSGALTDDNV